MSGDDSREKVNRDVSWFDDAFGEYYSKLKDDSMYSWQRSADIREELVTDEDWFFDTHIGINEGSLQIVFGMCYQGPGSVDDDIEQSFFSENARILSAEAKEELRERFAKRAEVNCIGVMDLPEKWIWKYEFSDVVLSELQREGLSKETLAQRALEVLPSWSDDREPSTTMEEAKEFHRFLLVRKIKPTLFAEPNTFEWYEEDVADLLELLYGPQWPSLTEGHKFEWCWSDGDTTMIDVKEIL